MDQQSTPQGSPLQLTLATGAFAVCFSVFGSVSAMMPMLKKQLGLDPLQVSIALAIPVLLGSLGRIPLGALTDRFGGRIIFLLVLLFSAIPAFLMGRVATYGELLVYGFFIGIALASFAVGVAFVSPWYPPQKQGGALGIYGAGNAGQSLAAFGAPVIAATAGFAWGFWTFGALAVVWLVLWAAMARNAPRRKPPQSMMDSLRPLAHSKSWILSLYYFLTFGGFVAMSIYLPTFLTEMFRLTPQDAGFRTAGFVVLATALRPVGGALADRIGGTAILRWVFPFTAVMALFLSRPSMIPFTVGALGMAAAIGLGNGAVFKLVPEYFPGSVGSVTGLVGASGGLGGFFPPLAVGALYRATGSFAWGFLLLGAFALLCFVVLFVTGSRRQVAAAQMV